MIDFSTLQGLAIPEGVVTQIADASGAVIWAAKSGGKVILEVEKITSDTYAGETTYTAEEFILLDIYPKTNGTVSVTYGGLTKTVTDTSGAEEPNAQQVFFGTFNGVSDSVATPASGTLTIKGDCRRFACGYYTKTSDKANGEPCYCITDIKNFGEINTLPQSAFLGCTSLRSVTFADCISVISDGAFYNCSALTNVTFTDCVTIIDKNAFYKTKLTNIEIPSSVTSIGHSAFNTEDASGKNTVLKTVKMLGATPPELVSFTNSSGVLLQMNFGDISAEGFALEKIIVPKGCGNTYKNAVGWSHYANYIVEAS